MHRPSVWMMLAVLLLGILILREPRFEKLEESFLRWLLENSQPQGTPVPLTVVEIGRGQATQKEEETQKDSSKAFLHGGGTAISPLEYALFLQSVLEFQPTVVAFENILKWPERDKDQEQVFLDQAMRVPKLLLGAELTTTPDPDAPGAEIQNFTQVTGSRSDLIEFSGIGRQSSEEMRLISTAGFINLPDQIVDDLHVPLLFRYRGEVIPSFALEAILLWLRVTPAELKIDLSSHIALPNGRQIPIHSDGTILIDPNAAKNARQISLNQLLVAAQQRGRGGATTAHLEDIRDHIVLAHAAANPLAPPDLFAATIATIQSHDYVCRVSRIFDYMILVIAMVLAGFVGKISRWNLVLGAIAFTAGYCLIALAVASRWLFWLPGFFPLGATWLLVLVGLFGRKASTPREVPKQT
ncbi:MAG: CHASE2 domain-containing protein [Verrucomicrobiota bacterium]|nr:CHASE2 domain-containing protein [Verrucomicrobiota bacterium]